MDTSYLNLYNKLSIYIYIHMDVGAYNYGTQWTCSIVIFSATGGVHSRMAFDDVRPVSGRR